MAGDGGYSKAWRHYVSVANFADAGAYEAKVIRDMREICHQLDLDETGQGAVKAAAEAVIGYLSTFGPFKRDGGSRQRDAALAAIDHMEDTLMNAAGRYD